MKIINAIEESTLRLGYQGEDERTRVVFDLTDLVEEFGTGTVSLLVARPLEVEASPVLVSQDEENPGLYYWDVTDADTQIEGSGAAQIVFVPENRVAKTHVWRTQVAHSLSETENPPEPWTGWVNQVLEAAAEIEQTAQEIPTLIDAALQEAKDSGEFDGQDGRDGTDGVSPLVSITDITGGHRISITDAAGTHTADIMDGVDGTDGIDGVSPLIQVTDITGGHRLTITDASGINTVDIIDGVDGRNGVDGFSPSISVTDITGGHRITVTNASGSQSFDVIDGVDGIDGQDGYSPTVSITSITGGHRVTITDKTGSKNFDILDGVNGQDGAPGRDGTDGQDGYSPSISVTDITGGHRVTVTNKTGSQTFDVIDGVDGAAGQDGTDGVDGFSPSISVTNITGGHRVTVTNKTGSQTFDVIDGVDGTNGTDGTDGSDGYSPTISVTDITGGHRLTITDVNGSRTVDVMDGDDAPGGTFYGTCSAVDSGTGVCTVVSSGYALNVGGIIVVAFSADVPQSAMMNVASTGSKPISYKGSNVPAGIIKSGDRATFMYDGTNYVLMAIDHTASQAEVPYGICNSAFNSSWKTVSIDGVTSLYDGLTIRVKFVYGLYTSGDTWLTVNNLNGPDDDSYHQIANVPGGLQGDTMVVELTFARDYANRCKWFVNYPKFSATPTPASMGLCYYAGQTSTYTSLGTTQSIVDVPSNFNMYNGALIVCTFDADVSANGQLLVDPEICDIQYRGANITAGVIKAGDTCMFAFDSTNSYWILLSNDRWGVGVT